MESKLKYSVSDGLATITLDYSKNLNAIDEQMADELLEKLDQAKKDSSAKIIIINSAGRAFSAGGDIGYFYDLIKSGGEINMDPLIKKVGKIVDNIKKMDKLVITSVSGAAAGAGASIALSGDLVLCSEDAKFILAFVNLGLVPDTGVTYILSKSIGASRTMELALTGRPLGATEAKSLGICYEVCPGEDLVEKTQELAKKLASGPLISYKNIKKQIYDANYKDFKEWLEHTEIPTQHECAKTKDFQEGCKAFMEKRKPLFKGQ